MSASNSGTSGSVSKCPFHGGKVGGAFGSGPQINDWWPNRLQVELLHQNPAEASPLKGEAYREAFERLDLDAVKSDIRAMLTDSQDCWPAKSRRRV